jgi:hypothetical protein
MPFKFMWLITMIPAALVVAIGLVVRSRANSQDAAARWQRFLFLTLMLLLILALTMLNSDYSIRNLAPFLFPSLIVVFATFLLSLTDLQYWSSQRIKKNLFYILGIGTLAITLAIADFSSAIYLVIPAFVVALTWKIWGWRSPWRLIALLLWITILAIECDMGPSALSVNLPESLQTIYDIVRMSLPIVTIVIVARLIHSIFIGERTMSWWNIGLRLLLTMLLLFTIAYQILAALANDIMTDGLAFSMISWMASITGLAAAMLLAWSLEGKRRWVAFGFALLVTLLLPSFEAINPPPSPVAMTEQRAEQVNQAILRYRAQEGKYPNTLIELSPWYLWHIPEPIMLRSNNAWCYEGDKDYYRLGYLFHEGFGAPASVRIKASVGIPPTPDWQCDRDVSNYNLSLRCGYENRTGCPPSSSSNQ